MKKPKNLLTQQKKESNQTKNIVYFKYKQPNQHNYHGNTAE